MPGAQRKDSKSCRVGRQSKRRNPSTPGHASTRAPEEMISSNCSSGESYWNFQRGGCCPMMSGRPFPYMDGQTVKNNLTVDRASKLEGQSHCLLLVEPVLIPDLGHTGVQRETLPGDQPLFYMNGHKNCGLGATIRNALRESTYNSQQEELDCRHQHRASSEDVGSSLPICPSHSSLGTRSEGVFAAIPAGQGGKYPRDVWETPPGAYNVGRRVLGSTPTGKSSSSTTLRCAGTGDGKPVVESQHQHDAITSPSRAKTIRTRAIRKRRCSSTLGWTREDGFCGGGRDSEWSTERRAADKEAKEVLGAMRRNNARLWFLVGGGF